MATLTHSDYKAVLKYYGIDSKKMNKKAAREKALDILANKLCRCIKKVEDERKAVAVCKDSVLRKKGLHNGRFTCDKGPRLLADSKNKEPLTKTRKRIKLQHKKRSKTRSNKKSRVNKIKRRK
tara:strand:+ start:1435 stop:1803 length:369 start_codon:yes stop_codon:yes gene_type:complete